jgi:hypothetical protein
MLRTTLGLSFVLLVGGFAACSSKATDDGKGTGGNGAIVGGSGGTTGNGAGTTGVSGGKATGGATGTGGNTGACTDETITCVDATMATGCNFITGVVDTFSCVDEAALQGFVSNGCTKDPTGDFCSIDDFSDAACKAGTAAAVFCENITDNQQIVNVYVNCFEDNNDARAIVTCFSNYVTPTMNTANDCLQAEEACLSGAGGAGPDDTGSGGAGGAP